MPAKTTDDMRSILAQFSKLDPRRAVACVNVHDKLIGAINMAIEHIDAQNDEPENTGEGQQSRMILKALRDTVERYR